MRNCGNCNKCFCGDSITKIKECVDNNLIGWKLAE